MAETLHPPRLRPFRAVRYDDPRPDAGDGALDLEGVIVPLMAAADPSSYAEILDGGNPYNAYRLLADARADTWASWLKAGILREDDQASLYLYRIGYRDDANRLHQVSAVIGELSGVAEAADDAPFDAVPMVIKVEAAGFSDLLVPSGLPLASATDLTGAHHRIWAITQPGVVSTICDAIARVADDGRLDVPAGNATRMACVAEGFDRQGLPAIGITFRARTSRDVPSPDTATE